MLPTATAGLIVAGLFIIIIFVLWGRAAASRRPLWTALALQVGGATGNLIDRMFRGPEFAHGRVVDFIDVQVTRTFIWPTFNLADIGITVGALLIGYCIVAGKAGAPEALGKGKAG
jgi:signal peptidase II